MKKLLVFMLALILVASVFTGCTNKVEETETATEAEETEATVEVTAEPAAEPASPKVGFVTDEGGIDDKSFNETTWAGVVKYCEEQGWVEGEDYSYIESSNAADYIANLSYFGEEGYDIVVAAGYQFGDALAEVVPQFPDTNYVFIDGWTLGLDNLSAVSFKAEEGSYLVGVVAAAATKTGKVGFIGGKDEALIQAFEAGYEAGIMASETSVELTAQYADSYVDSAKGQAMAAAMFDSGIDIIYCAAGGVGNGAIAEAKSRREAGEDVYIIGVDRDQYADGLMADGTSVILTSMFKRVDVGAYKLIEAHYAGQFPGDQFAVYGIAENAVGIPDVNPNLSADIVAAVEVAKAAILDGTIVVPTLPADMR